MSKARSSLQNRYYWAVLRHIARVWMPQANQIEAQKELHREFKGQILGYEEVLDEHGRPALEPISTVGLDADEFSEYIEAVIAIAVDAGTTFPDSPEQLLEVAPRALPHPLPGPRPRRAQAAARPH